MLSSYYVIILPIGVVIAGIGMAFNHVITVWQWITFYRRPGHLSPRIARHFVNVLILSPLMMIIGTTSACILLPDFDTRFHVPIFYIFSGFCVLAISIGYKCVTNSLSNGQQIRCCNKCQDWIIWFFHGSR